MKQEKKAFEYTGTDNLEVMLDAVNYNAFLASLTLQHTNRLTKILDYGAGIGTFAEMIRNENRQVDCLEPDEYQSQMLKCKGFTAIENVQDIPDNSYDFIYSLNVIEHIEDDYAAVAEIYRILRPGGTLLIYVPAFEVLFGAMDRKVGHYRRYTRATLKRLVGSQKFDIHANKYVDLGGFFATLLSNLINQNDGAINHRAIRIYDRFLFPVSRFLDIFSNRVAGKNVYVVARKSVGSE